MSRHEGPLALTQDFDGPCLRCGRRHCCLVLAAEQSRCPRGLRGWTQEETWGFLLKQRRSGNLPPKSTFCGPQNVVLCLCYLQLPWNRVRWCCFPWQFWSFFQPKGVWGLWRELGQQKHVSRQFKKKIGHFSIRLLISCWKCMEVHVFLFNWMRWFSPNHAKRVLGPNEIKQLLLYWTCAEIMTNESAVHVNIFLPSCRMESIETKLGWPVCSCCEAPGKTKIAARLNYMADDFPWWLHPYPSF